MLPSSDCNPGIDFSIPGFGIGKIPTVSLKQTGYRIQTGQEFWGRRDTQSSEADLTAILVQTGRDRRRGTSVPAIVLSTGNR